MFRFFKLIPVFCSKYVSLNDIDKYDVNYLYNLLYNNDLETHKNYIRHMPKINRMIIFGTLFLLLFVTVVTFISSTPEALRVFALTVSVTISANLINENSYKNRIKEQIEHKKFLMEQAEKEKQETEKRD